jgi:hypothetical protein
MDILIFLGFGIIFIGLIIGFFFLRKKLGLKDADIDNLKLILELIDVLNAKYDWKYTKELSVICDYVLMALKVAKDNIDMTDLVKVREYVFLQAEAICQINGIIIDEALRDLLGKIIDTLIAKGV